MAEIVFENDAGRLEQIVFDVTIREQHGSADDLPRHPVELSADVNDHIRSQPRALSLLVGVTNKPIRVPISEYTKEPITTIRGSTQLNRFDVPGGAKHTTIRASAKIKGGGGVDLPLPPVLGVSNIGGTDYSVQDATFDEESPIIQAQTFTVEPMDRVREVFDALDRARGRQLLVLTSVRTYQSMAIARVDAPVERVGYIAFTIELEDFRTAATELVPSTDPLEARGKKAAALGSQAGYDLPVGQQSASRQMVDGVSGWLSRNTVAVP